MLFFQDLLLPFIIAAIAIGLLSSVINMLLKWIHLNFVIIKVPAFLFVWYFVGPIIYNWLLGNMIQNRVEWIRFIYLPIEYIVNFFSKLV